MTLPLAPRLFVLFVGCVLFGVRVSAEETGFRVLRAELSRREDAWILNADLDYRFSDTAIDALRNGVPLTLNLTLAITRARPWLWDERVLTARRRVQVRYHSLAKTFQLTPGDKSGAPSNYASFHALLEHLEAVRGWVVAPRATLPAGGQYRARLNVALDIEALPLPLRPTAYLTPAWRLKSPWFRWSFAS